MQVPKYVASYRSLFARLVETHGRIGAMEWIVGGPYDQIGILEHSALITLGLRRGDTLVDVGCGSGRLPFKLRDYLTGHFIGTDILVDAKNGLNIAARNPFILLEGDGPQGSETRRHSGTASHQGPPGASRCVSKSPRSGPPPCRRGQEALRRTQAEPGHP